MEVPIPAEIITEILSNLGKNDLLKCRLVGQSWNKLSLKLLRNPKYGHEHELTQDNIQKFLEFSNERTEEWVLPFHLNFQCRVWGEPKHCPHQIPNYIQQLQSIFGEKCVSGFTWSYNPSSLESVEVLISILTLLASSLTHLDLSQFTLRYKEEEKTKVKEMLGKTNLNFPNLSKLKSCRAPIYWNEQGRQIGENEIHSFLIAKSQNLKELEVVSPYDLLVTQKQIASLRKLKIVKPFAMKGLDIDTILEPMRTSPLTLPVLKDLTLTYCTGVLVELDHQVVYEFLSSFSTSLQSLTVVCEVGCHQIVLTNPLPRLSHLRFLRIQTTLPQGFTPNRSRRRVDLEQLNLNSETFPVLESMDISTKIYFESKAKSGHSKDDWILPTVKNLKIRMTDSPFNACETSAKDYVDHLQELFPNVISLTLVNDSDGHEEYLKQLLIAFIQSDGAQKIKELEIQDCEENYLGHILNGLDSDLEPLIIIKNIKVDEEFLKAIKKAFQAASGGSELSVDKQNENRNGVNRGVVTCKAPIHLKMTGLEKIRMSSSKEHRYYYEQADFEQSGIDTEDESNQTDLFLMSLPKHLPLLRQIEISHFMFRNDQQLCKQQIIHVQDEFPDLIINTTL